LEWCWLDANALVTARIATLVALDASVASYFMYVGFALDVGVTIEQIQSILIAIAPIVGTPRTASAAQNQQGAWCRHRRAGRRTRRRALNRRPPGLIVAQCGVLPLGPGWPWLADGHPDVDVLLPDPEYTAGMDDGSTEAGFVKV
jgi:hypothetical protein